MKEHKKHENTNKLKYMKGTNGITLIALVITIIVLLILAGVSIATLTGNNGILTRAQEAKEKTEKAQIIEEIQTQIAGSFDDEGIYNSNIAVDNLKRNLDITATKNEDNSLNFNYKGYNIAVSTNGIVTIPERIISINTSHTPIVLSYNWEELNKIAKAISNNYDMVNNKTMEVSVEIDNVIYTLGVGDITTVDYDDTTKEVRILGFNHDKLESLDSYGGENIYAGISFEFVDSITSMQMNSTNTNLGGWKSSELRNSLNDTSTGIIESLNNKEYIKKVKKSYIEVYNDESSVKEIADYLWLLACSEIWNNGRENIGYGYALTEEGEQYQYYANINADSNSNNSNIVKGEKGWWLRSPFRDFRDGFCFVDENGLASCSAANSSINVTPGFSI